MEFNKMIDVVILCILVEICRHVKMGGLITFEVNDCPQNQPKWDEAALRLNCSVDRHGKNTYHCVPNQDKSSLVEFCYNRLIGRFQGGYCLQLTKTLLLHSDNCLNILPGCPTESYLSNKIFKYPECQHINTVNRCYVSDQACSNKKSDPAKATTKRNTMHNSSYELSTVNNTTPFITKENFDPVEHDFSKFVSVTLGIFIPFFALIITCIIIERIRILKQKRKTCIEEAGDEVVFNSLSDSNNLDENLLLQDTAKCTDNKSTRSGKSSISKMKNSFKKGEKTPSEKSYVSEPLSKEKGLRRFSKKEDALSPSLRRVKDSVFFSSRDEGFLHFLLCMDNCSADFDDPKTLNTLENSQLLSNVDECWTTTDYIAAYKSLHSCNYVQINGSVVTLMDDMKDSVVKYMYLHGFTDKFTTEDKILDTWNSDIIKQYVRIQPYQCQADEKCIMFRRRCIDKLIGRLRESVLSHPLVEDKSCHQRIAEKLKIPEEILKMEAESRHRYEKYLQLGKIEMYRARAMFVGCARAGKTTIVKRLLNNDKTQIQEDTDSTVGLEVHDHVLTVDEENCQLKGNDEANKSIINDNKLLSLLDFAGQSAYYACHQVYLSYRAFYCLVVDMSKNLNDIIDPESCEANGTVFQNWTYKDYFIFWLKSIHTYCSRRHSGTENESSDASDVPVILIVTHCEGKSDMEVENFFYELTECLPMDSKLKKYLNTTRYCSFSFEYEEGNDHQRRKLERIMIETIKSQSQWGQEIPASWAEFEHYVEKEKKEQKQKVKTLPELRKQGSKIGLLKDEEIYLLLRFFHGMGLILSFPESSLKETVILDIQWFVNAFKNIIADKNHVQNAARDRKEYERLMKTGELNVDLLLNIWNEYPSCNFTKYKDYILPYMQRLGLLAGCMDQNMQNIYYVPSMNKKKMNEKDMKKINEARKKTSVLIFKFDFLPYFVFYRLVVSCIEQFGYLNSDNETCFYHNMAIFYHKDHYLGIAVTENSIRVQIFKGQPKTSKSTEPKLSSKVTLKIRESIEEMLSHLTRTFHSSLQYTSGYNCLMRNICENDEGDEFIAESMLTKHKEQNCENHGFGETQHYIVSKKFLKYWKK